MFVIVLFWLSAILTIASSVFLIVTKNIMHACTALLGTLIGVAGLYLSMGADFVAAVQIMVYVGGVVILMLFAVMLTGGKDFMENTFSGFGKDPYMGNKKTLIFGAVTATVFLLTVYGLVSSMISGSEVKTNIGFKTTVNDIGVSLLTDHVLAFEISSILLLGALIGAAIIARPKGDERG